MPESNEKNYTLLRRYFNYIFSKKQYPFDKYIKKLLIFVALSFGKIYIDEVREWAQ
jgi:hypothetical protein